MRNATRFLYVNSVLQVIFEPIKEGIQAEHKESISPDTVWTNDINDIKLFEELKVYIKKYIAEIFK